MVLELIFRKFILCFLPFSWLILITVDHLSIVICFNNWFLLQFSFWFLFLSLIPSLAMGDQPNSSSEQNSNDPSFVHHSYNPRSILVSQILMGENYASWSRSMKISLLAMNKFDLSMEQLLNQMILILNDWNCGFITTISSFLRS